MMRRIKERVLAAAPFALALPAAAGLLLRLTVRDAVPLISTLFYATPPVLTAVAAAGAAGIWAVRRSWLRAAAGCALALLLTGYFLGASWFDHPGTKEPGVRVFLWNVSRGSRGWTSIGERIRAESPDLAVLVESGKEMHGTPAFLEATLPEYDRCRLPGGLVVAVRGRLLETSSHPLADRAMAALVRFSLAGREWTALVVDLWPDPLQHRRGAFESLDALRLRVRPDLVLGDFNTPRDSVFFDGWRPGLVHAFEAAGCGCDATWPMPIPVLAIDHVWCRHDLRVLRCRHEGSRGSDHRSVTVDLARP